MDVVVLLSECKLMNFGILTTQQSHGIKNTIFHQRKKEHQAQTTKYLHSMAFVMFHGVLHQMASVLLYGDLGVLFRYYFGCFFSKVAQDQIVIENGSSYMTGFLF
jgi:hypothetical protein